MANEKRMIDANKLESKLQEHHDFFVDGVGGFRFLSPKDKARVDEITNCIAEVVNSPTVDAAEVKHGRWEKAHVSGYLKCNCCNDAFIYEEWLENGKWNYCPNCGAKLDGDGNEILEI